jgi:hypothetical protein
MYFVNYIASDFIFDLRSTKLLFVNKSSFIIVTCIYDAVIMDTVKIIILRWNCIIIVENHIGEIKQ